MGDLTLAVGFVEYHISATRNTFGNHRLDDAVSTNDPEPFARF